MRLATAALLVVLSLPAVADESKSYMVGTWVGGPLKHEFLPNGDYILTSLLEQAKKYRPVEGAWKFTKHQVNHHIPEKREGNTMVYLPSSHCCFYSSIVGSKLILSATGQEGLPFDCKDRTLTRVK